MVACRLGFNPYLLVFGSSEIIFQQCIKTFDDLSYFYCQLILKKSWSIWTIAYLLQVCGLYFWKEKFPSLVWALDFTTHTHTHTCSGPERPLNARAAHTLWHVRRQHRSELFMQWQAVHANSTLIGVEKGFPKRGKPSLCPPFTFPPLAFPVSLSLCLFLTRPFNTLTHRVLFLCSPEHFAGLFLPSQAFYFLFSQSLSLSLHDWKNSRPSSLANMAVHLSACLPESL